MDVEGRFKEFLDTLRNELASCLGKEYEVMEVENIKYNNKCKMCLSISKAANPIAAIIYVDGFFKKYDVEDITMEEVVTTIVEQMLTSECPQIDTEQLLEFEKVKDHITCRIINKERNLQKLGNSPYTEYLDLVAIYQVTFENKENARWSAHISNSLLKQWGIEKEELHELALENLDRDCGCEILNMRDIIPICEPGFMYIMRSSEQYGAACVLNPDNLEKCGEKIGCDYYLLPSSLHEVICIPAGDGDFRETELKSMVVDVNRNEVSSEDFLSDSVYFYDRGLGELRIVA